MKSSLWREYDVDQTKIEQLRAKVFEYTKQHPAEIDIDDVKNRIVSPDDLANNNVDRNNNATTDWMLKRFLISAHKDVDAALKKIVEFFSFRKQFNMSQMRLENVLPSEFFQVQPFDCEGFDKDRNRVLTVRLKYYRKLPQFEVLIKRGIIYFAEQLDLQYEQGLCDGVCLVLDSQDFSVSNLDMDLLQFMVKQVPLSYAGLVKCMLVYELPFLMNYLFKVVEGWMPATVDKNGNKRKRYQSVSKKTIDEFIDVDQRPSFLNGKRSTSVAIPQTSVPFDQMIQEVRGIDEPNAKKIQEYMAQLCQA